MTEVAAWAECCADWLRWWCWMGLLESVAEKRGRFFGISQNHALNLQSDNKLKIKRMTDFSEYNEIQCRGRVEVICGSMFSGKTEELIRRIKRARIARQRIMIFKPAVDTRYSDEDVVSHDSNSIVSVPVRESSQILDSVTDDCDVVGIDEAQFLDKGLVDVCNLLASRGIRVIIAGLDMDFKGVPFGPIPALCATADTVTKVHAICVKCGDLAYLSHRITDSKKRVLLGEQDKYEPLCRRCYLKETQGK